MISLIALVRPARGASSEVIRDVSFGLRAYPHLTCAAGELLVTVPRLGTALVTESRSALRVDIAVESEDAAARACAGLMHELAGAPVAVSWTREDAFSVH